LFVHSDFVKRKADLRKAKSAKLCFALKLKRFLLKLKSFDAKLSFRLLASLRSAFKCQLPNVNFVSDFSIQAVESQLTGSFDKSRKKHVTLFFYEAGLNLSDQ
jgi:hypothetical protein